MDTSSAQSAGCSSAGKCPPRGLSATRTIFVYPVVSRSDLGPDVNGSYGNPMAQTGTVTGALVWLGAARRSFSR